MNRITDSNNSTINRQEQQNQQQQQKEQYQENDNNNYNNIIITTQGRACSTGQLPGNEVMELIAEAYRANISREISQAAAGIIEEALKGGMEPKEVIMAIKETGLAPRPSAFYLRAVLRNWAEWGYVTCRACSHNGPTKARPWWR